MQESASSSNSSVPAKRAYQACEFCANRKHKCQPVDNNDPKPPCIACKRAQVDCVFPEKKRRGRPSRLQSVQSGNVAPKSAPESQQQQSSGLDDGSWYTYMNPSFDRQDSSIDAGYSTSAAAPQYFEGSAASTSTLSGQQQPSVSSRIGTANGSTSFPDTDERLASETLAGFSVRNTDDAVRLLDYSEGPAAALGPSGQGSGNANRTARGRTDNSPTAFLLIDEGIVDEQTLYRLFRVYLSSAHSILPIIPCDRLPTTKEQVKTFAIKEPHLVSAILVVASSLSNEQELHDRLWTRVKRLFADVALEGDNANVGAVEGLLLLSEYPPRQAQSGGHVSIDRMCWMSIGVAVRLGYLLNLEQSVGLQAGANASPGLYRDRVAWTYCYFLDRQISIRAGRSFWCRGPGLSPQNHLSAHASQDYPQMQQVTDIQDDYASYIQCLVQLTQTMSNAHDVLYPSKSRSLALAKAEQYYKHIDDFTENLASFQTRWQKKLWSTYPINECVWITFHYIRLYIYAFSFQAHMQRMQSQAPAPQKPADYFPAGLMGCPDARFILEAIDAAADVLRLVIGRLHPVGALAHLPLRFFLYMFHAAVFLLKASLVAPLPDTQNRAILRLVRTLSQNLQDISSFSGHPALKHAVALAKLLQKVHRDQDFQSNHPTRAPSPDQQRTTEPRPGQPSLDSIRLQSEPPRDGNALLGGSQLSPFIAQRPFQELAVDLDALFGTETFGSQTSGNQDLSNSAILDGTEQEALQFDGQSAGLHDPLSSLFEGDETLFWQAFATSAPDWSVLQGTNG